MPSVDLPALATAFVYYGYLLFGGICVGYIFLRLTEPETRVLESKNKLSRSLITGIVLVGAAIFADALSSGTSAVTSVSGSTPLFAFAITVAAVLGFNFLGSFRKPGFVVVGVPVSRQSPGLRRLLPLVQEVIVKPSAVAAAAPVATTAPLPSVAAPAPQPHGEATHGIWRREGREATAPPAPVAEKKGFFEKIFGGTQSAGKPAKKSEEADVEVMIKELRLVQPPPKPVAGAQAQPTPSERHRLYQKGGAGVQPNAKSAREEVAKQERDELNALFQDVYSKLKEEQKPETLKEKIGPRVPPKPSQAARGTVEEKGLSIADLFGEEKPLPAPASAVPAPSGGLFAELEQISEAGKAEKEGGKVELVKMRVEKPVGCPTCRSKNSRIIFCPYCGTGLCANCAPSVKPAPDAFVYVCPKCGEDVTVKRKSVS